MKTFKVLSIVALTFISFIFVFRPFNGQVVGLPSDEEPYATYFEAANAWFDSVADVHTQEIPILEKIESKLFYIGKGLKFEKDGKWLAFDTLEKKLDNIVGLSDSGLPPEAVIYYNNANSFFTTVSNIHSWKGDLPPVVKGYFNTSNSYFDMVRLIHNDTLFADSSELWRVEQKLWSLNQALKNEKHAKKGAFEDLEAKLDTLLGREYLIPDDINANFDTSDIYFDSVDVVHEQVGKLSDDVSDAFDSANSHLQMIETLHWEPIPPEEINIEEKLWHLSLALRWQKEAMFLMAPWFGAFGDLEAKLDTLLGWVPPTMNQNVVDSVMIANEYFIKVDSIHSLPTLPPEENIEWKLFFLGQGLHYEKMAKKLMFQELESKLDQLLNIEFQSLPDSVLDQFDSANAYFLDSIIYAHNWPEDESIKVEWKLHYLKHGLKHQKKATWWMFRDLEKKIDFLSGGVYEGLSEEIDSAFTWADDWLDSVNVIHDKPRYPAWENIEWKIYFLAKALIWEKEAKWMAFQELKRKLYEFDKVELKLYYLAQALKYEKDAKGRVFEELEHKLDDLLVVPFSGVLPESVSIYLGNANGFFNSAISIHWEPGIPELEKIMLKLINIKEGLVNQKEATRIMFDSLDFKVNIYAETPDQGLDPEIYADFDSASLYFGLIDGIQPTPGLELQDIEKMIYYLSQGQQYVKQAQEKMFGQWKEKLFEFDKIEKKLYNINQASQFAKDAKELIFEHLEMKLDTMFVRRGWEPIGFPGLVTEYFQIANTYFDLVNSTHERFAPDTTELLKIGLKIHYLKHALLWQKDATWLMFANLEQKLDSLLNREYLGLPEEVDLYFDSAGFYFDSVNVIYAKFKGTAGDLLKIEEMLDAFTLALKFAKDAKWLMFDELEDKIDSLPETGVREIGERETVPEKFVLMQNYPNPFNPITNIEFSIPEPAWVKVEIYNILGEKIVTLVDEKLSAGHKIVEWDGKDNQGQEVSTGIYFYRLKAGDFTQTRKMVLLK